MADTSLPSYPWYAPVSGDEIAQGDILEDCSVYSPRDEDISGKPAFDWAERDVIILTQSCDLVKGREKVSAVRCR